MSVQSAQNSTKQNPSSENMWQMVDGEYVQIHTDNGGMYFIKGGTEKVYLAEYNYQKSVQAKKDKVQKDITNFFSKQESDFAGWRDDYASKIAFWTKKIATNQTNIFKFNTIEETNIALLNPLYEKYQSENVADFQGKDKSNGYIWQHNQRKAKHQSNVATSLIATERWIIEGYKRLMNNSEACRKQVVKIAENTFRSIG